MPGNVRFHAKDARKKPLEIRICQDPMRELTDPLVGFRGKGQGG